MSTSFQLKCKPPKVKKQNFSIEYNSLKLSLFLFLFQNDLTSVTSNLSQSDIPIRNSSEIQSSDSRPPPLFGHAMEVVPGGFVIFGGMSPNGLSDQIWFFNLTTLSFERKASDSDWKPPPLSEHTLTSAKGFLYVFGGSTLHGKFSRQMFRINESGFSEWEPVETRGTKETDLRVTGHTMVYSDQCRYDIS